MNQNPETGDLKKMKSANAWNENRVQRGGKSY
jgi:hypothetical protein